MKTLNICTDHDRSTGEQNKAWGVENCPCCRGVGLVTGREVFLNMFKLHETVCPGCVKYHKPFECEAWQKVNSEGKTRWIFNPDDSCEELHRIYFALDSLRCNSRFT
jgi:hypothetical protein